VNEVIRVLLGAFIVAHGLLTAFIWVSPAKADAPFRATHSWLVGDARPLAVVIALVAAAGFVVAGVGVITQQAWWAMTGVGAGAVALLLMTLFFNPWLLAGIAISAGVLYAGVQALPQA
jgi:predicted exporter